MLKWNYSLQLETKKNLKKIHYCSTWQCLGISPKTYGGEDIFTSHSTGQKIQYLFIFFNSCVDAYLDADDCLRLGMSEGPYGNCIGLRENTASWSLFFPYWKLYLDNAL